MATLAESEAKLTSATFSVDALVEATEVELDTEALVLTELAVTTELTVADTAETASDEVTAAELTEAVLSTAVKFADDNSTEDVLALEVALAETALWVVTSLVTSAFAGLVVATVVPSATAAVASAIVHQFLPFLYILKCLLTSIGWVPLLIFTN